MSWLDRYEYVMTGKIDGPKNKKLFYDANGR